ncbi:hypothetical protein SDC9_158859 [bioreactor metagenome]|uniref:N-acetyltransferase domain-containing protein n=1 Tax=bioreactor metagenome TaxID=1076179 RepID=A0A645FD98_9ZZZZ
MNVEFSDCVHKYIQLGTVMTDPEFRNRGLIRQLMEVIFHDYKTADGFFLFANDQVKSFYPLFNFQSQTEYRYALIPKPVKNAVVQLTMNGDQNGKRFLELKQRMHSLAAVEFDNDELMMFYLISINQHDVYYIAVYDALLIARLSAGVLNVYAIYSSQDVSPAQICECWMVQYDYALFHFNPRDKHAMIKKPFAEENTTLFVKGHKLISDLNRIEVIPLLAHA